MRTSKILSLSLALTATACSLPPALADVTSPSIKDKGKKYTTEKPLSSYYGTGNSGRLVEASELRMAVDDLLSAGEWEKAIPKARKAVQLDPGDPSGHLFLAKAMTMKLYQSKGAIDEKLLFECMNEWELIRRHDADPTEQWEAGNEVKRLRKIAKALEKEKIEREKEEALSGKSDEDGEKVAAKDSSKTPSGSERQVQVRKQLAEKKKRFGLF